MKNFLFICNFGNLSPSCTKLRLVVVAVPDVVVLLFLFLLRAVPLRDDDSGKLQLGAASIPYPLLLRWLLSVAFAFRYFYLLFFFLLYAHLHI